MKNFDSEMFKNISDKNLKMEYYRNYVRDFIDDFNNPGYVHLDDDILNIDKISKNILIILNNEDLDDIFLVNEVIKIIYKTIGLLPNIDRYTNYILNILILVKIDDIISGFSDTLNRVFNDMLFCDVFVTDNVLDSLYEKFLMNHDFEKLQKILPIIYSNGIIEMLIRNSKDFVCKEIIRFLQISDKENNETLKAIISFHMKIQKVLSMKSNNYTYLFADEFANLLSQINNFDFIWGIFSPILIRKSKVDYKILTLINKFYIKKDTSVEIKQKLLETFLENSIIYDDVSRFGLQTWFVPEMCSNDLLFSKFIKISFECVKKFPNCISPAIIKFIDYIAPPLKENILYEKIIKWFMEIEKEKKNEDNYEELYFIQKFLLEIELDEIQSFLKKYKIFGEFFKEIFESPKVYLTKGMYFKFMDVFVYNYEMLKKFTVEIIGQNPISYLEYIIRNLNNKNVQEILSVIMNEKIMKIFKLIDGFSFLENDKKILVIFLNHFKYFNQDFFIDDWIISQSKENQIFKIDSNEINNIIFDKNYKLLIPSLFPLTDNNTIKLEYNLYLIGKFAIPVYRKLDIDFTTKIGLSNVISRYINISDFFYLIKHKIIVMTKAIQNYSIKEKVFEFYPNEISYLSFNSQINSLLFDIKFLELSNNSSCILLLKTIKMEIIDETIYIDKNKVFKVELNKWYKIMVMVSPFPSRISFYINNSLIYQTKNSLSTIMIGNNENIQTAHYLIKSAIFTILILNQSNNTNEVLERKILQFDESNSKFTYVPVFSMKTIISDTYYLNKIFDIFENEGKTEQKDSLVIFISLIPNILESYSYSFFYNRFLYSLQKYGSDCPFMYFYHYIISITISKDINLRTEYLYNLIFNVNILFSLPLKTINELFFSGIFPLLSNEHDFIEYESIIRRNFFIFNLFLIQYFDDECITNQVLTLFSFFGSKIKNHELYKQLSMIGLTINMINFNSTIHINNSYFYLPLYFTPCKNQSLIIESILNLEKYNNVEIFSKKDLLSLAFSLKKRNASAIFVRYLNNFSKTNINMNEIPLLCKLSQRFPKYKGVFSKIIELITNEPFDLEKNYSKLTIRRNLFLPILYSFLIAVSKLSQDLYVQRIYCVVDLLFYKQYQYLFDKQFNNYLYDFLNGWTIKIDNYVPKGIFIPTDLNLSKADIDELYELFGKSFDFIKPKIDEFFHKTEIRKYESSKIPQQYVSFIGKLMSQGLIYFKDKLQKFKEILQFICNFAFPCIISKTFNILLLTIGTVDVQIIKLIVFGLDFCLNRYDEFNEPNIWHTLILFCSSKQIMREFLCFYIDNINLISEEHYSLFFDKILNFIEIFKEKQFHSKVITFIYQVLKYKIILPLSFKQESFKKFLEILKDEYFNQTQKIIQQILKANSFDELYQKEIDFDEFEQISSNEKFNKNILFLQFSFIEKPQNLSHDILITDIYNLAIDSAIKALHLVNEYYHDVNICMRNTEKFIANIYQLNKKNLIKQPKSYKISPYVISPVTSRQIVLPSKFPLTTPIDLPVSKVKPSIKLYSLNLLYIMNEKYPNYIPIQLFEYSTLFQCKSIIKLFYEVVSEFDCVNSCNIIRLDLEVPSIIFRNGTSISILLNTKLSKDGEIIFLPNNSSSLIESVLEGEFGNYSLFCGHFVLIIPLNLILSLTQYNYASITSSYELISLSFGAIIIQFDEQVNFSEINPNRILINPKMDEWVNGNISNYEYLSYVNYCSGRSYIDLCSYPIFPRVIKDYNGTLLSYQSDNNSFRDLSKQIATIYNSNDPIIKQRFSFNKFHHSENISNPLTVSLSLMRLLPFCNYQWEINQGWDVNERLFTSIPSEFSITSNTKFEFSPEVYSFPEVFQNVNNILLPNHKPFDLELPKWSKDATRFIEINRYLLECNEVRTKLNYWLDLTFGINLKGNGAIEHQNQYAELSYFDPLSSAEKQKKKHQWMLQCGQVPNCLFSDFHQPSKPINYVLNEFNYDLNTKSPRNSNIKYSCIYGSLTLSYNSTQSSFTCPIFNFIKNIDVSDTFIAITTTISIIYILRLYNQDGIKMKNQSHFFVESPKYSIIYEKLMMCLTVTNNELIIWSIINGLQTCSISIDNISFVKIDKETDSLFITSDKTLYHYTLNGTYIRKITLSNQLTSICILNVGFSVFNIYIFLGLSNGEIVVVQIDINTSEFTLISISQVSNYPILEINAKKLSQAIEVFDSEYMYKNI